MRKLSVADVLRRYSDAYNIELSDINQRESPGGDAPIHTAGIRGNVEELEALLTGGADPNMQGEEGCTPLFYAAERGHLEAVRFLLKSGASLSIRNNFGQTPGDRAAEKKFQEIVALLDGGRPKTDEELGR